MPRTTYRHSTTRPWTASPCEQPTPAEWCHLAGASFAGDDPGQLRPGTAMAIATGAPLPPGADSVVPVELAHVEGEQVSFDGPVSPGDHVRPRGTDVPAGAVVIAAGNRLGPLALAAVATSGVAEVRCHRAPRVCVVVTGDELVAPGQPLLNGQIHESNSILIAARCAQAGAHVVSVERVRDDAERDARSTRAGARACRCRRHLRWRVGRDARSRQARAGRARRRGAVLAARGAARPPDLVRRAGRAGRRRASRQSALGHGRARAVARARAAAARGRGRSWA